MLFLGNSIPNQNKLSQRLIWKARNPENSPLCLPQVSCPSLQLYHLKLKFDLDQIVTKCVTQVQPINSDNKKHEPGPVQL